MTPAAITAWIAIAQQLIPLGVDLGSKLKQLFHTADPNLTDAQIHDAYEAVMADDAVRSAIAALDAGIAPAPTPAPAALTSTTTTSNTGTTPPTEPPPTEPPPVEPPVGH